MPFPLWEGLLGGGRAFSRGGRPETFHTPLAKRSPPQANGHSPNGEEVLLLLEACRISVDAAPL